LIKIDVGGNLKYMYGPYLVMDGQWHFEDENLCKWKTDFVITNWTSFQARLYCNRQARWVCKKCGYSAVAIRIISLSIGKSGIQDGALSFLQFGIGWGAQAP